MKLNYLILLALAVLACLATVTEAGKKKDRRLTRGSKKAGKRFNALGKGKKKGRKGKGKKNFNAEDEDEEENKKKPRKGRGKGKGKKGKRMNKKNKKGRKGSKNFSKGKKGGKGKDNGKKSSRKTGKSSYGKVDEKIKKKGPKMCTRAAIKELPGGTVVEFVATYPDGFVEVNKAAPDFGLTGGCEATYCIKKKFVTKQYKCTTCTKNSIMYDVGQCIPVNDYVKMECMVNKADPQAPAEWKTVGSKSSPMSITQVMQNSDNPDMCFGG